MINQADDCNDAGRVSKFKIRFLVRPMVGFFAHKATLFEWVIL